jgi:hypothetical protein
MFRNGLRKKKKEKVEECKPSYFIQENLRKVTDDSNNKTSSVKRRMKIDSEQDACGLLVLVHFRLSICNSGQ